MRGRHARDIDAVVGRHVVIAVSYFGDLIIRPCQGESIFPYFVLDVGVVAPRYGY